MKEQSSRNIQTGSDPELRQIQEEITIVSGQQMTWFPMISIALGKI